MFKELNHKAFEVGGSIRNELLGKKPNDIDYVIQATESEFEKVFPNAKRVGNTFPVYLIDGFEVALTRKEKNTGKSYQSFELEEIGVSIETDLSRRDFTLNSISRNYVTGEIIDPFNGTEDIKNGIIKTINPNFVKDDPLRIYRLARFASEFDFRIDKKTADIIKRDQKEIVRVLPERIYQELKKNYERSSQPSIFFRVLYNLDVLKYHFKPLFVAASIPAGPFEFHPNETVFDHLLNSFDNAKLNGCSFSVAISSLLHDLGKVLTPKSELPKHIAHEVRGLILIDAFFKNHRFDAHTMELTKTSSRYHIAFHNLTKIKKIVKLIRFFKAIRKNINEVIQVAQNDSELSKETIDILDNLKRTFNETIIDIPDDIKKKGRESIVNFVEDKYVKKYKEIINKK